MTGFAARAVTAVIRYYNDYLKLKESYIVTPFVKPAILSGDYVCLVSYISSDSLFLVVYSLVLLSGDSCR